jgi:plastocyanin
MRMQCILACGLLAGAFILSACSGGASSSASASSPTPSLPIGGTVTLSSGAFLQASVTISAGQAVRLVNPADTGGTHHLCLGQNGKCDPAAQGPADLQSPGFQFTPGESRDIGFTHAGQYAVTCTIHPSMKLVISVLGTG